MQMNYPIIPGRDPERTTLVNALARRDYEQCDWRTLLRGMGTWPGRGIGRSLYTVGIPERRLSDRRHGVRISGKLST